MNFECRFTLSSVSHRNIIIVSCGFSDVFDHASLRSDVRLGLVSLCICEICACGIRKQSTLGIMMQQSTMAGTNQEPESKTMSADKDRDAQIRQSSINVEPRTLHEMSMEQATIAAQKIFAEHPSEDFTKDAVDTATRENAPAEDAGDANSLQTHL